MMRNLELEKFLQKPRRFGTEENKITQNLLEQELLKKNYPFETQTFFYEPIFNYHVLIEILLMMIYIWGLLNIFLIWVFEKDYYWSYFFWMLASILIYLFRTGFYHDFKSMIVKNSLRIPKDNMEKQKYLDNGLKSSSNIYAIKESNKKPNNMIIISANFDSASITLNQFIELLNKIEYILVPVMGALSLLYFLLVELNYKQILTMSIADIVLSLLIFLIFISIFNFFDIKQNRSPGAVNNGSSVIALIRFTDILKDLELMNTIVILAFFNGKEEQMVGSTAFCEFELPNLLEKYRIKKRNVSVITLESVGALKKQLYLRERFSFWVPFHYHQNLKFYLKNFGVFYDFILKEKLFSIRNSDHIPFMNRNYNSVNIFRDFPESNTKEDTSEKISEENIESILVFLKKFVEAKDLDLKFEVY